MLMRRRIAPPFAMMMLVTTSGAAMSGDCSYLAVDPLTLRDGSLLYRRAGIEAPWAEVVSGSTALANQTIEFTYVVRETIYQRRSGVAVIKTGHVRRSDEPVLPDAPVALTRNTSEAEVDPKCPAPASITSTVSARSYDDYHDRSRRVRDQQTLEQFHYSYAGYHYTDKDSYGGCKRTNATKADSRTRRTNIGQFSFDPAVVAGETPTQLVSFFTPTPAFAASDRFGDRQVAMHAYATKIGFPSCVRFQIKMPAAPAFVRINDLEGLKQDGQYYVRADESRWEQLQ